MVNETNGLINYIYKKTLKPLTLEKKAIGPLLILLDTHPLSVALRLEGVVTPRSPPSSASYTACQHMNVI